MEVLNKSEGDIFREAFAFTNSTLTELDIGINKIGYVGTTHLSDALMVNSALTNLCLHGNKIGDSGATSLSEMILDDTTALDIYLS